MLLGPFDLLRSKQDEIAASRRLIEARRDWWTQAAELGRLLGGAAEPVAPLSSSPPVLANPDIKENRP
jgi:outer membrane protein TolC